MLCLWSLKLTLTVRDVWQNVWQKNCCCLILTFNFLIPYLYLFPEFLKESIPIYAPNLDKDYIPGFLYSSSSFLNNNHILYYTWVQLPEILFTNVFLVLFLFDCWNGLRILDLTALDYAITYTKVHILFKKGPCVVGNNNNKKKMNHKPLIPI